MPEPSPAHLDALMDDPQVVIRQTQPPAPSLSRAVETDRPASAATDDQPSASPVRIMALMNQKGGVGKTTTTVNLGAALARAGKRVLLVDLDPQAHLTLYLGLDPQALDATVYDLLTDDDTTALDIVQPISENLAVLPAEVNLAGVETELATEMVTGRAQRLLKEKCEALLGPKSKVQSPRSDGPWPFDYVLIDCPPSLGLLTINSLTFANEVIVPMQAHFLALQGLSKLLETVSHISDSFNPQLAVTGIAICMYEGQTILANEVIADLETFLTASRDTDAPWRNAVVLQPPIRRNIKLAESPSFGQTIFDYAPDCHGASDYQALAEALIAQQVNAD